MDSPRKDGVILNLPVDTGVTVLGWLATVARAGKIKTQGTWILAWDLFVWFTVEWNNNSKASEVRIFRKWTIYTTVSWSLAAEDLGAPVYLKAGGLTKVQGTWVNVQVWIIAEVLNWSTAGIDIDNFAGSEKAVTSA